MKRMIALSLAVCMTLCFFGCAKEPEQTVPPTTTAPAQTTVPATVPPTEPPIEPPTEMPTETPTEPPTEPPVVVPLYTNPLTGEPMDEPMMNRPFAIMHNNIRAAQPQCGISSADIFYEMLVEGGITRCMGLYSNLSGDMPMGSMRSARLYYAQIAQGYDAIYVHAGGSEEAYSYLRSTGWNHLDGVGGPNAGSYFYRDQKRLSAGYALEHTMFITADTVVKYAADRGFTLEREEEMDFGLHFVEDGTPDGTDANQVIVNFRNGGKTTTFDYDPETALYMASQFGKEYADGNNGQVLAFTNLLILESTDRAIDNAGRLRVETTGGGNGYFACGGKIVPITWSRDGVYDNFQYFLEDGTELNLGIGKTYIAFIAVNAPVQCS